MSLPVSSSPEPFRPPSPLPPRRGRDRALSAAWVPADLPEAVRPRAASRHWGKWVLLGLALGLCAAVLIPGGLGVYYGMQDRAQVLHAKAVEHFQSALAYEAEQYTELAIAELQLALKFDPSYQQARDKLSQLQNGAGNATPVPNDVAIADQLFQRAQKALAGQQWDDAINALEDLERAKADYRANEVRSMLVEAYLNAGQQAVSGGDVAQARARFDAALALEPNNAQVQSLDQRAALYMNGAQAAGADWQAAAQAFQQLYQLDPTFGDVKQQLLNALANYGDFAMTQGSPCVAAREYDRALALGAGSDVAAKSGEANTRCRQAVTAPTPTPAPLTPPAAPSVFTGQGHIDMGARCQGTGGITGTVRDAQGAPLAGIKIKIYNDYDYRPPPFTTQAGGDYVIILGIDPGIFHLLVINPDGSPASATVDVNYGGGSNRGCHWVVDWTKGQ